MNDLKNVTALVKSILETDKQSRNSDSFLYFQVLNYYGRKKGIDIHEMSVPRFLLTMKQHGFPPFESVRRARQKVQRKFPELSANKEVQAMRNESQKAYCDYARSDLQ